MHNIEKNESTDHLNETTVDAMLHEVQFRGPSAAEIKLRKYGLTPSLLNRHMESESLR